MTKENRELIRAELGKLKVMVDELPAKLPRSIPLTVWAQAAKEDLDEIERLLQKMDELEDSLE